MPVSTMDRPVAMGASTLVAIRHVSKQFANGTIAVRDVNLDLARGEFVSLLGPSGCGKSTLLRMIAGLGEPSVGTIDWTTMTHDAWGRPARELGFVFQDPTLMPCATALDNVVLPLKLAGMNRGEADSRGAAVPAPVGPKGFATGLSPPTSGAMK